MSDIHHWKVKSHARPGAGALRLTSLEYLANVHVLLRSVGYIKVTQNKSNIANRANFPAFIDAYGNHVPQISCKGLGKCVKM